MNRDLSESSGYTLAGSMTRDLTFSKVWLISEIEKIQQSFSTIYILGSWYANMSLYIKLASNIQADKIINVETNDEFITTGNKLLDLAGVSDNIASMKKDANKLNYQQLGQNGLIINTSLNDISGEDWFKRIPRGTLVALQARNNSSVIEYKRTEDIIKKFPLKVLYSGSVDLEDPETEYTRFMVIGIK